MTITKSNFAPDSLVVDEHRQYWRPEKIRLVLLAESHVYTTNEELRRTLKSHDQIPKSLPRGFVRFVYCLGYGENELLDEPVDSNPGTWQFWKIFHTCVHGATPASSFNLLLKKRTKLEARIQNKIVLLQDLKARGIWLVDASVDALYQPGKPKLSVNYKQTLLTSWNGSIRPILQEAKPHGILCIGKNVARTLKSQLNDLNVPWGAVPQPQARLPRNEHLCILDACGRVSAEPKRAPEFCAKWSCDPKMEVV
jgi:hypothetical protein